MSAENQTHLINCRACGEPLAEQWRDGSVKPLVLGWYRDPRDRLVIVCQHCGTRRRIPPRYQDRAA